MGYPVTVDALQTVFSPYGPVQKIAIFEKGGQHQVKLCVEACSLCEVKLHLRALLTCLAMELG